MWGKLVSLNPEKYVDIDLVDAKVWLGREKDCHKDGRYNDFTISKKHCCISSNGSEAVVEDTSSNGTFISGNLVGKGKSAPMKDSDILTLVVPSTDHQNFSPSTVAYKFFSTTKASTEISDSKLDELRNHSQSLQGTLTKLTNVLSQYCTTASELDRHGKLLVDILSQETDKDPTLTKMTNVLAKILRTQSELHTKMEELVSNPMKEFLDQDVNGALKDEKAVKENKKKKEELEGKMKKQTDPFKIKQTEEKLTQIAKDYEIDRATLASKLGEIKKKSVSNYNAWLIGYLLSSLESFRQGYNFLKERQSEMSKQAIKKTKEIRAQEEKHKAGIERLKQIHSTSTNLKLKKEKQGYLLKGKRPLWFIVMDGVVSYYKSWKESNPIVSWDLMLCSVKLSTTKKLTFELTHPEDSLSLQAMSKEDLEEWLVVFKNAIAHQLEAHKKLGATNTQNYEATISNLSGNMSNISQLPPLNQVQMVSAGNRECADCCSKDPDWVSINNGVIICYECSGIHRSLGTHISKVRSLTLDKWEPQLLQMVKFIGNAKANKIFEAKLGDGARPSPTASREVREKFIKEKYVDKKFVKRVSDPTKRLQDACNATEEKSRMIVKILQYIIMGAKVNEASSDDNNTCPLHVLAASGHLSAMDLLLQNEANLDSADRKGWTPLHYAASCDQAGSARLLINRGAKTDPVDETGVTPLDVSNQYESKAVKILLEGSK